MYNQLGIKHNHLINYAEDVTRTRNMGKCQRTKLRIPLNRLSNCKLSDLMNAHEWEWMYFDIGDLSCQNMLHHIYLKKAWLIHKLQIYLIEHPKSAAFSSTIKIGMLCYKTKTYPVTSHHMPSILTF